MSMQRATLTHSTNSTSVADLLERVLDKGIVIAGDIRIKLVDIELLTIQLRLVICSVDKAREMGIDWWTTSPYLNPKLAPATVQTDELNARIARLEAMQQAPAVLEPVAVPVMVDRPMT